MPNSIEDTRVSEGMIPDSHKGRGNCWWDSHVTKKTRMMCAAWNTVIIMLLLGVWEVGGGGGGGKEEGEEQRRASDKNCMSL